MVNLNRQIRATQARQGGFSAHVLPGDVGYQPRLAGWGMGWFLLDSDGVSNTRGPLDLRGYSGDGAASASFTIDASELANPRGYWLLPVHAGTFVLAFGYSIQVSNGTSGSRRLGDGSAIWDKDSSATTTFGEELLGVGRKGFLLSNTSASVVDISEDLSEWLWPTGPEFTNRRPYSNTPPSSPPVQANWDNTQDINLIYDPISGSDIAYVNSAPYWPTLANTGAEYEDPLPAGGTNWRISLENDSGFARATTEAPLVGAADEGSVWFKNYNNWDGNPYRLQRYVDDAWAEVTGSVSLVASPQTFTPQWTWTSFGNPIPRHSFFPCISVPFTDRRDWFQSEFGMTIT